MLRSKRLLALWLGMIPSWKQGDPRTPPTNSVDSAKGARARAQGRARLLAGPYTTLRGGSILAPASRPRDRPATRRGWPLAGGGHPDYRAGRSLALLPFRATISRTCIPRNR